ncbi:MAG: DUF1073 domain-containing protein [Candidatus Hydrogenedentes bacterium]|nr:DUF1073 domain-containing protein [Candidatus Hydrogenedentota bacterium]
MAKKKARSRKVEAKMDSTAPTLPVVKTDGFANALTGLGDRNHDSRLSTVFRLGRLLTDPRLTALYRGNGLTRRIMNLPAVEMTRNWFTINGDDKDVVLQKLETLGAQEAYTDALTWARLYGGSIILIGLDDGMEIEEPVNTERIRDVMFLHVFDRRDVEIVHESIPKDPTDPLFGKPTQYKITPITGGSQFTAHASRVVRFDGAKIPGRDLQANNWWHDSILEAIYEQVRQIGAVYDSSEFIVNEFIMTIIQIDNMLDTLMAGNDDLLKKRLEMLDLSKHVKNTILLDTKESFSKHSSTVAGLDKLLDSFMMSVSSVTGIPVTLLMGRSPAGQNATGESDIRMWYDSIRSAQRTNLRPRLEMVIRYCFAAAGDEPETWSIEFNPLWEMNAKEKADIYKINSEGDQINVMNGIFGQEEIGKYRYGGAEYNATPPTLDMEDPDRDAIKNLSEQETARMQAEAEAAAAAAAAE